MFSTFASKNRRLSRGTRAILPLLAILCATPGKAPAQGFAQSNHPAGVATDSSGNVYVASLSGGGSMSQSSGGAVITKFDPTGQQIFQTPLAPKTGPGGNGGSGGNGMGGNLGFGSGNGPGLPGGNGGGNGNGGGFPGGNGGGNPGPGTTAGAGRLVFDETLGTLWYLSPTGQILFVSTKDGSTGTIADMAQQQFDTSKTIDIGQGAAQPLSGQIDLSNASWGDVRVLWLKTNQPNVYECDFFMTAVGSGVPAVARIRLAVTQNQQGMQMQKIASDVVIASQAASMSTSGPAVPTGLGIDPTQGNIVTTLPVFAAGQGGANGQQVAEHLVTFPFDLGLRQGASATISEAAISGRGITTDQNGYLYIATGPSGASICQDKSGAPLPGGLLLMLRPDGNGMCFYYKNVVDSQDVAVSPDLQTAYLTLGQENVVAKIALPQNQPGPNPPGPGPNPPNNGGNNGPGDSFGTMEVHGKLMHGQKL